MKKISLILLLALIQLSFSQFVPEWVQLHTQSDLTMTEHCLMDASGNIIVANNFFNNTEYDVVLTKYSSTGSIVWSKTFTTTGFGSNDFVKKLLIDASGNFIIAGNATPNDYSSSRTFLVKFNANGDILNSVIYSRVGGPFTSFWDAAADPSGNIVAAGGVSDNMTTDSALIVKFGPSLNLLWERTRNDTNYYNNTAYSVKLDPSGNSFIAGASAQNLTAMKYDASGTILWFRKFNVQSGYDLFSIRPVSYLDNSQNFYVADIKLDILNDDTSKTLLLKYNSAGALQWSNTYNVFSYGMERAQNIYFDNSSIFIDTKNYDLHSAIKVDQNGQQQWTKAINHPVHSMKPDGLGNIIVTGYKGTYNRTEAAMDRVNSTGVMDMQYSYTYNGSGVDQAMNIFFPSDQKPVLAGMHNSSVMLLKLSPSVQNQYTASRSDLSKSISDLQYTYDTISITALQLPPYTQVKNVYVNIDSVLHTAIGDLSLMLIHGGKTDTLIYQRGGTFDNMIGTKFADSCAVSICGSGIPPYTGYYKPCWLLSQFNNISASGPWILKIYDRRSPDTGVLKAWSLSVVYETPIGLSQVSAEIPERFSLSQNYPNPFNPVTKIKFSITELVNVKLEVFDILGKKISVLVNDKFGPGVYEADFDASTLPSGVYFYKLSSGTFSESKKMVLIK
jgi:hypothetical protein